jgi:hypothetical protein
MLLCWGEESILVVVMDGNGDDDGGWRGWRLTVDECACDWNMACHSKLNDKGATARMRRFITTISAAAIITTHHPQQYQPHSLYN